jgi:hypothetical protein
MPIVGGTVKDATRRDELILMHAVEQPMLIALYITPYNLYT